MRGSGMWWSSFCPHLCSNGLRFAPRINTLLQHLEKSSKDTTFPVWKQASSPSSPSHPCWWTCLSEVASRQDEGNRRCTGGHVWSWVQANGESLPTSETEVRQQMPARSPLTWKTWATIALAGSCKFIADLARYKGHINILYYYFKLWKYNMAILPIKWRFWTGNTYCWHRHYSQLRKGQLSDIKTCMCTKSFLSQLSSSKILS